MKLNENICEHDFTYGYCPYLCVRYANFNEQARIERDRLCKVFGQRPKSLAKFLLAKRRVRMNTITKETFVLKLIEIHMRERYGLSPKNLIVRWCG